MGYIAPVRNEPLIQYGNRMASRFNGISPIPPVIKAKYHETLARDQTDRLYRNSVEKKSHKAKTDGVLQSLTGKGQYINEIV